MLFGFNLSVILTPIVQSMGPFWLIFGIFLPPLIMSGVFFIVYLFRNRSSAPNTSDGNSRPRHTKYNYLLTLFTIFGSAISVLISLLLIYDLSLSQKPVTWQFLFFNFTVDSLSAYFLAVVNLVALFAAFFTNRINELGGDEPPMSSFHALFNGFHATMLLLQMLDNLLMVWVMIVLTTIISAPLIGYTKAYNLKNVVAANTEEGGADDDEVSDVSSTEDELEGEIRRDEDVPASVANSQDRAVRPLLEIITYFERRAREASWKYIVLSSVGIVFSLFGTILFVGALSPATPFSLSWSNLATGLATAQCTVNAAAPYCVTSTNLMQLAFLLIVLGYGTKAGLFPMHSWLPDGHGEAPSSVSAMLSGVLLKSAVYVIVRFTILVNLGLKQNQSAPSQFTSITLIIFGLVSLVAAVPFILNTNETNHFKRVLAFHSLQHMGIIVFAFGLGTPLAILGALLHVLNHGFTKALMFLGVGRIYQASSSPSQALKVNQIQGVFKSIPVVGGIVAIGGVALVGAPPFSLFLSELLILVAALQRARNGPFEIVIAIIYGGSLAIIFAGLMVHMSRFLLGRPVNSAEPADVSTPNTIPPSATGSPVMAVSSNSLPPNTPETAVSSINSSPNSEPKKRMWHWAIPLFGLLFLIIYSTLFTFPYSEVLNQSVHIICQEGICQ